MNSKQTSSTRNIALVGSYLSGKTTLLESLLFVTKTISRKGKVTDKNTVGDSSTEARDRSMSVEVNVASIDYEGIHFNLIDCPGSVEFLQETYHALMGVDLAIVVCEPNGDRVNTIAPLLKFLDDWKIPHLIFINKMDRLTGDTNHAQALRSQLAALKTVSSRPLVAQQYPISSGNDLIGFIDLVTEQAYQYHVNAAPDAIALSEELAAQEQVEREAMLETIADFDDHLLEELLTEIKPSQAEVLADLQKELSEDQIVPVFFGVAEQDFGVRPLLKALVIESPQPEATIAHRQQLASYVPTDAAAPVAQVLKTYYTPQGGKLSLVRLWLGKLTDGTVLNGSRIGGLYRLMGGQQQPITSAEAGDIVAVARLEGAKTGDTLTTGQNIEPLAIANSLEPVFAWAIAAEKRNDEVKLSNVLNKLCEEDPALRWEQRTETHEIVLLGQGEIHLQVALDRMRRKYNLPISQHAPQILYKETIRKSTNSHGRYKHQSGGHGQFGDVYLDIQPLPRGEGFKFAETIVGGVVPRQYIAGVETGVREYLHKGILGFPIVDIAVTLTNGSYHSVDSSEQAFKQAARLAMQEGMATCEPILLEPINLVEISIPTEYTSSALRLVSGRRGQILGYESKAGWQRWDKVSAYIPEMEMQSLILELRSQTMGVGFFSKTFDRLQEVPEKLVSQVVSAS
ncbi:elongation factor G [Pseudanabaena mucicola]|uniref:Elongation factor G n=1 Tax=Pseudanabaena mucicola FACHB-723 TaxID=2692860 RepID=A0ABR7ZRU9_9CYAN|nr:elongation factor G [Pseudanabaena mucicola]MBD2186683.1 elongation factor G [Pseudanabaena mucicola FACHB-723]